jgi:hypothetical protein
MKPILRHQLSEAMQGLGAMSGLVACTLEEGASKESLRRGMELGRRVLDVFHRVRGNRSEDLPFTYAELRRCLESSLRLLLEELEADE